MVRPVEVAELTDHPHPHRLLRIDEGPVEQRDQHLPLAGVQGVLAELEDAVTHARHRAPRLVWWPVQMATGRPDQLAQGPAGGGAAGPGRRALRRAAPRADLRRGPERHPPRARSPPGRGLPSSRELAAQLGVARTTVLQALEGLVAEGYVVARARSGLRVAPELPSEPVRPPGRPPPPSRPLAAVDAGQGAGRGIHAERRGWAARRVRSAPGSRRWISFRWRCGAGWWAGCTPGRAPPRWRAGTPPVIRRCARRSPPTSPPRGACAAPRSRSWSPPGRSRPSRRSSGCCSIQATRRGWRTRATSAPTGRSG